MEYLWDIYRILLDAYRILWDIYIYIRFYGTSLGWDIYGI